MDDRSSRSYASNRTVDVASRRILASTSGNAQVFPPHVKSHLDFSKPCVQVARAVSEPQYLVPCPTLGSNDRKLLHNRLAAHKARRNSQPRYQSPQKRSYLQNEKYLAYCSRKRQDLGDDGKAIWPDHVEAAFQNALINIPPIGNGNRGKRTQRGRMLGRNELIKEWIFHETGEIRHRKQVSSHIQQLGKFIGDDPDWVAVTAGCNEDHEEMTNLGSDYYFDSIADKVRLQQSLSQQAEVEEIDETKLIDLAIENFSVSRVNFEMWVGMPEKVFRALHDYTRIPNQAPPLQTEPLENYKDWRELFPDLEVSLPSLEKEPFDVILLKSRFSLMSEFPLATSKLVLDLDLDLRDPTGINAFECSQLRYFTCINHMYHNGKCLQRNEHKDCKALQPGVVKPFFEAEWWAAQFTELTRKKKEADDSKDEAAIKDAEEESRSFFRGLTIMQEIFVSQQSSEYSLLPEKRVAILLWVFARTHKSNAGITSWQKMIMPPHQQLTNDPLPIDADIHLPSLTTSGMVDGIFDTTMTSIDPDVDCSMPASPITYDSDAYHSGFTPYHGLTDDPQGFDFANITGFTPRPNISAAIKPEPLNLPMPTTEIPTFLSSQQLTDDQHTVYDDQSQVLYADKDEIRPVYEETAHISPNQFAVRDTITHFDMNTHNMLQAQLGKFNNSFDAFSMHDQEHVMQEEPLDSQHPAIDHLHDLGIDEEEFSQVMLTSIHQNTHATDHSHQLMLDHPTLFMSPKIARPPLLAHNSFAGISHNHNYNHTDSPNGMDEALIFDTPTRNEFARAISGHFDSRGDEEIFGNGMSGVMDSFPVQHEFSRSRSQPNFVLHEHDHEYGKVNGDGNGNGNGELLGFETPTQLHPALPAVHIELS